LDRINNNIKSPKFIPIIQNGKKSGYGKFTSSTGERYDGQFMNDMKHGRGIYINQLGYKYEGDFSEI
jgi:hypothetical protein